MIDIETILNLGGTFKKVKANEIIFNEGEDCHFYYQLISGSIRWVNINMDGKEFVYDNVKAGECFGEFPLFDNVPYAASAIANTDAELIRLKKESFQNLLQNDPVLMFDFCKLLVDRLRFGFHLVKDIAGNNPEEKICSLLSYYKMKGKNVCPKCNMVLLTRKQIANMTGLRVETVIRSIRHLKDTGKLQIQRGKVFY